MLQSILCALLALALSACAGNKNTSASPNEGEGEGEGDSETVALDHHLPAMTFAGVDAVGHRTDLVIGAGELGTTMIVVSGGAWCGTCRVLAQALSDAPLADVQRIDLVLADRDNATATVDDAEAWQQAFAPTVAVGVDPSFVFEPLLTGAGDKLPLVVLLDAGVVVDAIAQPARAEIAGRIDALHAQATGVPAPERTVELIDDRFTPEAWALLQLTTVPDAPPPDLSNAVADNAAAAAFGAAVFSDAGFSPSNTVACSTCHDERFGWSDQRARAHGVAEGTRRSPSIALTAHQRHWFWDGRADSLWAQATGPFENPAEYNSSRAFVARRVVDVYAEAYRAAFPQHALPTHDDIARWPLHAKPGDAAWEALDDDTQTTITRVFVDTAKAIAAYERTLRVQATRFDAYLAGDRSALTALEKLGLGLFVDNGCMQCHWGPRLTDDAFHAVGLGTAVDDDDRALGSAAAQHSEFRRGSVWDDSTNTRAHPEVVVDARQVGQHKTPPLRGVADGAFFTRDGSFADLGAVTSAYGLLAERRDGQVREAWLPFFGETAQWGLLPFLRTLTATTTTATTTTATTPTP